MEVETAALVCVCQSASHESKIWSSFNSASQLQVRAAEDILSLTRILKESWLFGKLQTVGTIEAERKAEESAVAVAEGLRRLGMIGGDEVKS